MYRNLFVAVLFILGFTFVLPSITHADAIVQTYTVGSNPGFMSASGTMVYVSNGSDRSLSGIDTALGTTTFTVSFSGGGGFISNNVVVGAKVYAIRSSGLILVIDTANGNAVSSIPVPAPTDMVVVGSKIYVSNNGGAMTIIDTANNDATSTVTLGAGAGYVAAIGTKVYRTGTGGVLNVLDTTNNATSTIGLGVGSLGSQRIGVSGSKVYVNISSTSTTAVVDTANSNATSSIPGVGSSSGGFAFLGSKVYETAYGSNYVLITDTANGNATTSVTVGPNPESIIALNGKIYTTNYGTSTVSIINPTNGNSVSSIDVGNTPQLSIAVGSLLYISGGNNHVTVIDTNPTAAVLTQVTPIPSSVSTGTVTYYYSATFPTGEAESVLVGGDCTGLGVGATQASSSASVQISGLQQGHTYSCTLQYQDAALNFSNILNIGPFTRVVDAPVIPPPPQPAQNSGVQGYSTSPSADYVVPVSPVAVAVATSSSTSTYPLLPLGTRDLKFGMTGDDVKALQRYLNVNGFAISASGTGSLGNESPYFGALTRTALSKWQVAHKISPSAGYFGKVTRTSMTSH